MNEDIPATHCVIPDGPRRRLLLEDCDDGRRLPTLAWTLDGWSAMAVKEIGLRIGGRFGLDVTVLRDLGQSGQRYWCEVEVHGGEPTRGHWVPISELVDLTRLAEADRTVLESWLREASGAPAPPTRSPWERPGWHAEAVVWIREQLADLGLQANGPIRQFKAAWSWSCLLEVPTTSGQLFFKAVYDKPPGEVDLILALQPRWAQCLPRLLAADERGWMLMENFDGEPIEKMAPERWVAAASRFGQLQMDCAVAVDEWLGMGCPDRRLCRLPALFAEVLADEDILLSDPEPLTAAEMAGLRTLQPVVGELCAKLSTYDIPESLHHQDFRSGNLIAIGDEALFYDWGDTVVSHPFLSLQRMLDFVDRPRGVPHWDWEMKHRGDRLCRAIRDAYLKEWTCLESPRRLTEVHILSRQLNVAYQAIRWHQEIPHVELDSGWGRVMPRATKNSLRQVLEIWPCLRPDKPLHS
ncbi:MAG TPA: hypothetical protein QGF95_24950 [Candidatus Latescibacteria bacterium]|nr:hypothetical protein [Candidatus Latescibacterota bacterium]HJP33814.1 hypothetical protein [Candidatus Latescibacterota bacterium]